MAADWRIFPSIQLSAALAALALSVIAVLAGPAQAMQITVHGTVSEPVVGMHGAIEIGDTEKLARQLAAIKKPLSASGHRVIGMTVVIESNGGNVSEALKLGRFLRANNAVIYADKTCGSSCIFVLAGGVVRGGRARLIIHRPFGVEISQQPLPGTMRKVEQELGAYLREMNMPGRLVDMIFSIAPEHAHELSASETAELRLNQMDIEYAEDLSTYNARVSGLSRVEYMRRLRLYRQKLDECDDGRKTPAKLMQCFRSALDELGLRGDYDHL